MTPYFIKWSKFKNVQNYFKIKCKTNAKNNFYSDCLDWF